ncbi:MAG: 3-oxoacyl-ACP synthase III family protein [Myxococcota bacterium]
MSLYLNGIGHFHPENEISNRFLVELDIGTTDPWIVERVGIRSRRTVLPLDYIRDTRNVDTRAAREAALYSNAQMGARAADAALARAGIARGDVGLVIAGSSGGDWLSPAQACTVAAELSMEVPAFDITSACTSFYAQLYALSLMQPEKLPDYVLLVVPESLTTTVDYNDRATAVLWGDGASAAVVSPRQRGPARILGNSLQSSPAGWDKVTVPRSGHFAQHGRTVQTFGIKRMVSCLGALRDEFETDTRRFHFVGHQANQRMLESACRSCGIPPDRHHANVEWYGNTGCASSASVVSMNWEKWKEVDDIGLVGVGAGLTWSSYLIRFGDAQ